MQRVKNKHTLAVPSCNACPIVPTSARTQGNRVFSGITVASMLKFKDVKTNITESVRSNPSSPCFCSHSNHSTLTPPELRWFRSGQ